MGLTTVTPPSRKTKRLSFRADEETCRQLDAVADALKMKKSDIIRQWINEAYEQLELDKQFNTVK